MVKMVCWNMAKRQTAWQFLLGCDADVALLQEASLSPDKLPDQVKVDPAPFHDADGHKFSRAAIVKLSDRVKVEWLEPMPIAEARWGDFVESQPGCIAAAIISKPDVTPFIAASICASYDKVHRDVGKTSLVDPSVHRVISDLSLLIGNIRTHRIVAAGDLTIWHGYGGNDYWKRRNDTVFDRMDAIGIPLVGPQHPHGRQVDPWPAWLPEDSLNVPTYYDIGKSPAEATHQLDYVFASRIMADSVVARALNGVEEWGPSDHCRIEIVVT